MCIRDRAYILYLENIIDTWVLYFVIIGAILGSLLLDIDASDSAIMHNEVKIFGKFFKHIIYPILLKLSKKLFDIEGKHRGIMHSILGILLFDIIFLPFSLVIAIAYGYYYNISLLVGFYRIMAFFVTLTLGAVLHVMEDGFTVSGVYPLLPKKVKMAGEIRTFTKGEQTFGTSLVLLLSVIFIYGYFTHSILITLGLDILILLSATFISRKYSFNKKE
mgnify:CR=1 FL=1